MKKYVALELDVINVTQDVIRTSQIEAVQKDFVTEKDDSRLFY